MTEGGAIPKEGRCLPNPNLSLILALDQYSRTVQTSDDTATVCRAQHGGSGNGRLYSRCGQYGSPFSSFRLCLANILAEHLRQIISNLYWILVQAYDYEGNDTSKLQLSSTIKDLITNLQQLTRTSRRLPTTVPVDLIQYVEDKRNPDVYKRQIVELVMQYNQLQKGRAQAFADFRDILGKEMMSAIPDMRNDVRTVLKASGGQVDE